MLPRFIARFTKPVLAFECACIVLVVFAGSTQSAFADDRGKPKRLDDLLGDVDVRKRGVIQEDGDEAD